MDNKNEQVFAYEGALDRFHRIIKWLIIVIIILIVALIGSNVAWIIYESQFQIIETKQENEIEAIQLGGDNIVNGGDIFYGYTDSQSKNNNDH